MGTVTKMDVQLECVNHDHCSQLRCCACETKVANFDNNHSQPDSTPLYCTTCQDVNLQNIKEQIRQLLHAASTHKDDSFTTAAENVEVLPKYVQQIEFVLSETLRAFQGLYDNNESKICDQDGLNKVCVQLETILDSNLVQNICDYQASSNETGTATFSTVCATYFNQTLTILSNLCLRVRDKVRSQNATCQSDSVINFLHRTKADVQFIQLLKLLKQIGRFAFHKTSATKEILEDGLGAVFKFKIDQPKSTKRFSLLIKTLLEFCDELHNSTVCKFHTEFMDWVKGLVITGTPAETEALLPYLLVYCEYNSIPELQRSQPSRKQNRVQDVENGMSLLQLKNITNETFVKVIRTSLLHENLLFRKQSLYILKSIVCFIRARVSLFFKTSDDHVCLTSTQGDEGVLLPKDVEIVKISNSFDEYTVFWSTFFELFDILDEKQIHIIEPCLQKLEVLEDGQYEAQLKLPWYCTLLHKMCYHDNRFIANQGVMRFLKSTPALLASSARDESLASLVKTKRQCMDFVEFTMLPVVKEKVGWLFRSGEEYFKCTNQLASLLLALMGSNLFDITKFLLGFIIKSCELKAMSPNSLFFVTSTLYHTVIVSQEKNNSSSPAYSSSKCDLNSLHDLNTCISNFNEYIRKCLPTLDKFLKVETQNQLMEIFSALITEAIKHGIDFSMPLIKTEKEDDESNKSFQQPWMCSALRFMGSIDYVLFCNNTTALQLCEQMSKLIFRKDEDFNFRLKCEDLSAIETCGFMRIYFCKVCQDFELMANQVNVDHHPYEVFSQLLGFGSITYFCDALTDFLNCALHRQYIAPNQDSFEVKNCWNLLIKLFLKCLLLEEAESAFDTSPTQYELHINSTITLLDVIVKTLPSPIIQHLNLQDETEELHSFLVAMREGLEWSDDIYIDKIQFRFFHIFAKLNKIYGLPLMPAFHIANFMDTFKNTDINAVPGLSFSSAFKSEFQEQRLRALTQVLFVNPKQNVNKFFEVERAKPAPFCWWSSVLDLLDKSGKQGVIPILEFASAIISFVSSAESEIDTNIHKFLHLAWSSVFEMRKTEAFWIGFEKYIDFIFDPYFRDNEILLQKSIEIFEKSERVCGLSLILMNKIASLNINDIAKGSAAFLTCIVNICTQATYFGPLLLENNKSTFEIWNYLTGVGNGEVDENRYRTSSQRKLSLAPSMFDANSKTRLLGIEVILRILNSLKDANESKHNDIIATVVTMLLNKNDEESKTKKRYFGDSGTHRVKQRIAQTLLVLQPCFTLNIAQLVTTNLLKSLANDNPQPSVRYLMEWIVIKNLASFPTQEFFNTFLSTSKECSATRIGFGAFFSTICLHVVLCMKDQDTLVRFCQATIPAMSVLVMGQHSTVRPYAQICFLRIFQHFQATCPHDKILVKYEMVYESLKSHLESSDEAKSFMYQKIENNFYVKLLHPIKHYGPQAIFIGLPRLANVSEDELAQVKDLSPFSGLMQCGVDSEDLNNPSYRELDKASWHKNTFHDVREMGEENSNMGPSEFSDQDAPAVYQKKINPWKYLPISQDIADFSEELQAKKKISQEDGLVLVATLLEKLPNLGGLCRTCEIFGVSKYAISSLRHLADQTFQNLSVSSEKWVNIVEVPKNTLREFLATYANKGYTILGIEQVSESVLLNDFKFPKKSVLLLGHEKFGIPPELLQVVDQCLEIPQIGVTRSLNVHVTGALCVWQYATQHSIC